MPLGYCILGCHIQECLSMSLIFGEAYIYCFEENALQLFECYKKFSYSWVSFLRGAHGAINA